MLQRCLATWGAAVRPIRNCWDFASTAGPRTDPAVAGFVYVCTKMVAGLRYFGGFLFAPLFCDGKQKPTQYPVYVRTPPSGAEAI
jgi:hypothetical protein